MPSRATGAAGAAASLRVEREAVAIGDVERAEVLRYLGYRGQELTDELEARMGEVTAACLHVARPTMALRSYKVARVGDYGVELVGCTLRLPGHDIAAHLSDAREVVLMAVTLGAGVDRELRRLSLTDPLGQVLFDAAATAAVERAADAAEARARGYAAARDGFASWRFSPGYGDLPLAVQPKFLSALDATRRLGISLTPTNLMVPTKSVTALVGVHPEPQPGLASSCGICALREFCTLRASGTTCRGR